MDRRTFLTVSGASLLAGCFAGPTGIGGGAQALNQTPGIALPRPLGRAQVGSALTRLTSLLGRQQIWTRGGGWSLQAHDLYRYIENSWSEGLQPTSYLPRGFETGLGRASLERDLALSAAGLKLVSDIRSGRTRPNYNGAVDTLAALQSYSDVTRSLQALSPSSGPYRQLRSQATRTLGGRGVRSAGFSSLETTMEKLRLQGFPDIRGQVIVVNIAAFDLHAYVGGQPALRSRVIVGQEGRQTPVGRDSITNLKFSPDWTPPRSIINRDLVPALQADPTALEPLRMEIFVGGRRVRDATSVNWNSINPNSVTMRQPPGPNAILGGVRFSLNNSRAIYLHDTSARPLFGEQLRTASSGCVRVEESKSLASWLLAQDGQPRSSAELDRLMTQTQSQFIALSRHVRVEMLYLTAWISPEGAFTLYPDVYNRDTGLVARLARG